MSLRLPDPAQSTRQYRRGAVMGLTVAEAFMLLAFVLLMLMMLWRSEDARRLAVARDFAALPPEQREAVLETARKIAEAGLDPTDALVQQKLDSVLAVPGDVLAVLAAAPEPERRRLEELIRTDAWRAPAPAPAVDATAERVARRLESAAASRAEVTRALEARLGPLVAGYGGTIEPDGALVFPETVLFEAGKSEITPRLRGFLAAICLPWFRTLEPYGAAISDLRIEGHASTEWIGATPEAAWLGNLALSQARAQAVLSTCLEIVPGAEGAWARDRATAVGYSSSHPVVVDGREDKVRSRRVVFRVDYDLGGVIDDIRRDVTAAGPFPALGGDKAPLFNDGPPPQ